MALIDNLISYWNLDESSGNAADSHGSNTLIEVGTAASTTGKLNNARVFDGSFPTLDGFALSDNAAFDGTDREFTFSLWMNPSNLSGEGWVISKWGSTMHREFKIVTSGTTLLFRISDSSVSPGTATWGSALSTNTWYHVCVWHDATNNQIGIVVNAGTPVTSSWSTGVQDGSADFEVGSNANDGNNWLGTIDEIGFWSRVLTSQERTDLYKGGAGLAYPFSSGAAATAPVLQGDHSPLILNMWQACGLI